MTAILESHPAKQIRLETPGVSRTYVEYKNRRTGEFCKEFDVFLELCNSLVRLWKEFVNLIDDMNRRGTIDDYLAISDFAVPYSKVALESMQGTVYLLRDAKKLGCTLKSETDFKIFHKEMEDVVAYFSDWPTTDAAHVEKIREEIARGLDCPFENFVNEVCTQDHGPR